MGCSSKGGALGGLVKVADFEAMLVDLEKHKHRNEDREFTMSMKRRRFWKVCKADIKRNTSLMVAK